MNVTGYVGDRGAGADVPFTSRKLEQRSRLIAVEIGKALPFVSTNQPNAAA